MTDVEAIESYLVHSGLAPPSVDALRPEFPRWARHLRERGVTEIPDSPLTVGAHASNLLSLLTRQGSKQRHSSIEHDLRNLTRMRPWKL
jgi:hypothetical protein